MLQNDYTQPLQQHRNKLMTVGLHLFVAIVFVGFFAASCPSVHAAGYMYSDMWVDDSSPTGNYTIDGCGVTEGSYGDMHEYHVESRISSPNGRGMGSDSGGYSPAYARADVSLSWDFADLGDYSISSDHWEFCIHGDGGEQNWMFAGSSFASLPIGVSASVLYKSGPKGDGGFVYLSVANCNVICPTYIYDSSDDKGEYILSYVGRGPLGCLNVNLVVANARNGPCYEIH